MIRLLTIVGARPQIIKAAAISRAVRTQFAGQIEERILHTGQHYDDNMSEVFFRELGIPAPDYNLHVGSGRHAEQTGKMMIGIENVLKDAHYDAVLVYGDTNSTLAAAVSASKLQVPVFHVEAGLRSYNRTMPEEINRVVCDQLSTILFAPTQTAVDNLQKEGMPMRNQKVVLSGDVMYDNSLYFSEMADEKSDVMERLELRNRKFVLATIHRPANTDNAENLKSILRALSDIAAKGMEVVLPLHPRTKQRLGVMGYGLEVMGYGLQVSDKIRIIEPVSFFDMIRLEKHAQVVLTDSGGVQKEAFFYGTPCVILRSETEWTEIVDAGAGILAGADYERIVEAYRLLSNREVHFPPLFGDGKASEKILSEICESMGGK